MWYGVLRLCRSGMETIRQLMAGQEEQQGMSHIEFQCHTVVQSLLYFWLSYFALDCRCSMCILISVNLDFTSIYFYSLF